MKKLLILLLLLTPIIGYSQTDVFGNISPKSHQIQFGNYSTFQGVDWRDRAPFFHSVQDKIIDSRSKNINRTYRAGRNPSNIRKMKWKKWNRQRKRAFKRINVWG
jgi:hypothetical protein